jgi:hypothetical protein
VITLTDFGCEPLNDEEQALSRLEQSWGDCACGFRTQWRCRRDTKQRIFNLTHLVLHEELEVRHLAYRNGDAAALLWALRLCLRENIPPPYWCSDGVLEKLDKLENNATSLHDLFGLERHGFKQGKSGLNAIARRKQAADLYVKVWRLKAEKPGISKEAALREVIKKYNLGISHGKARQLFDEKENEQRPLRKVYAIRFGGLRF